MNINQRVHELYWETGVNCAGTTLICLGEKFHVEYDPQVLAAAMGLHGAGGYGAQCGLVEGALMFLGIYFTARGKCHDEIVALCHKYAGEFTGKFGSLRCCELRPGGFRQDDPPHLCERLTCETVGFAMKFVEMAERG